MRSVIPPFKYETQLAIQTARMAARKILDVYKGDFSTEMKDGEPLTEADKRSNEVILKELSATPYRILSEESIDDRARLEDTALWIIDPLDGTSDFVKKTGQFSVLIGLVERGAPIAGVVYQPVSDILFVAQKGSGAYRLANGVWDKLQVSSVNNVSQARVVMSRHHLDEQEKKFLEKLGVTQYVLQGSCGLKIAAIAAGEAELYLTMTNKIKEWDTCAAHCIITEAGGKITDMLGNPLEYNTSEIRHANGLLVSNGHFHEIISKEYTRFRSGDDNRRKKLY